MSIKLGVNIDHIATLRQARKELEPDPLAAARVCRSSGADLIVAHLRQDRRHIQDADLFRLRDGGKYHMHLELAAVPEMVRVAVQAKVDSACIVPERPSEVTTEGGLKLTAGRIRPIEKTAAKLRSAGIGVSLFINPDAPSVRLAKSLGADAVELCTSEYAQARGKHLQTLELEKLQLAAYLAHELGLELHAGHGLDYHNVAPVAGIPHMACLNIGFSIVARAVFTSLRSAVAEMKKLIVSAR